MARNLDLNAELMGGDWRRAPDADALRDRLERDSQHALKAVMVVHNETSTGVKSDIPAIRRAIDSAKHPALLMVDTISSLASMDYRHDEWGVDVSVSGSQKGLMLPPGLSFNAISEKAIAAQPAVHSPEELLALGRDAGEQHQRVFPVHSGDQSALRPAGSFEDADR
jgi:alanine-glyoxylate transaminase/serine-glyoxylate transaminase/serine-pyruvate transaminase